MNEEIEDCNLIIQDFTAVSDWEIFILKIEEALNDWKVTKTPKEEELRVTDFKKYPWKISKESLQYGGDDFIIARYKMIVPDEKRKLPDENDKFCQAFSDICVWQNDFDQLNVKFEDKVPSLALWYGLRDFIVLMCSNDVIEETKIKMLLSSISIAVNNTGCEVPVFIQCHEIRQQFYLGVCESNGLCIKFDTVHLRRIPAQCYYLVGLLDIFKGKISSNITLDPVKISVKFTYNLAEWPSTTWTQRPPDFDFLQGQAVGIDSFSALPFGAGHEPIKLFILHVAWPRVSDDSVVDSQGYSDFNPLNAPIWTMNIEIDKPVCLLCEHYSEFINFYENQDQLYDILYDLREYDFMSSNSKFPAAQPMSFPSSRILDDSPPVVREHTGTISNDVIVTILKYIFIHSKVETELPTITDEKPQFTVGENLKADPYNGLLWRLSIASATVSQTYGGITALGHLWYEFCQEIRYRWESSTAIDGLMEGFPNSRTSLLHQKLQMINVCIDRRKKRNEVAMLNSMTLDESSDEEFFDCDTDDNDSGSVKCKPAGRLSVFGNLKLIETGEPMYVPMTQEPVPKTEDQLEQDAEVMLNLGTDAHASEMRANIMSASLLSDMESFRAANPDGIFEDFIRWYSPKDWIKVDEVDEHGQTKGHLSTRMVIEDNVWIQVWRSARAVPAKRQKRLFDDTTEAEKTLHYLESRNISQIVDLLLPSLTHAVLCKLADECKNKPELSQLSAAFDKALSTAIKLTRDRAETKKYKSLVEQVYAIELAIAQCKSLKIKFGCEGDCDEELLTFLTQLLNGEVAKVPGEASGTIGRKIGKMFLDLHNAKSGREFSEDVKKTTSSFRGTPFPEATEKEFVLRVKANRPVSTSTSTPQMMRVIIKKNDFRILGAFAEDVIFT